MKKLCAAFLVLLLVVCAVWLVACDCKHEYADWLVTTAPTCEEDGVRTRYCRKCDHAETETVPAGHTLTPVAGVSASCEQEGVIEHDRCTACNKLFIGGVEKTAEELVIPKTEHVLLAVNGAPASCHEDGVLAHLRCEYCGINYLRGEVIADADLVIPATHETVDSPGIEKTCTTDGRLAYIFCYDCGACFIGDREVTAEELSIPAGHDTVHVKEVAATCEEDGVLAHGAAAAGVPCKNTLKLADDSGMIVETPDRSHMFEIQTPQGFTKELICRAHESAEAEQILGTDDCYLAERLGAPVQITESSYANIKITTPEDLPLAEQLFNMQAESE